MLAVPVTALVAQSAGGYDVEVVEPGNARRWVPVTPAIFDDAVGLVQVTGADPGQRVVVPGVMTVAPAASASTVELDQVSKAYAGCRQCARLTR